MNDGIDMIRQIQALSRRPRGRGCIVLTHDYAGQKEWAAKLTAQAEAEHLDLLDHFAVTPELMEDVSGFTVSKLFDLLGTMKGHRVLVVSGIEFLLATWAGQKHALEQFAQQVENWNKSPALLFVVQYDGFLASRPFRRHPQYRFVVDQKETFALS